MADLTCILWRTNWLDLTRFFIGIVFWKSLLLKEKLLLFIIFLQKQSYLYWKFQGLWFVISVKAKSGATSVKATEKENSPSAINSQCLVQWKIQETIIWPRNPSWTRNIQIWQRQLLIHAGTSTQSLRIVIEAKISWNNFKIFGPIRILELEFPNTRRKELRIVLKT